MKKSLLYASLGLIAFCGTFSLAACTSSDDPEDVNPTYDPKTGEVTTSFIFNVSTGNNTTRMTADNVQSGDDAKFRGIEQAYLFAFDQTSDHIYTNASNVTPTPTKRFSLGSVIGNDNDAVTNGRQRVLDLAIPLGTRNFVFYGKAPSNDSEKHGKITYNIGNDLPSTSFSLVSRVQQGANATIFTQMMNMITAVMTRVALTGLEGENKLSYYIRKSDNVIISETEAATLAEGEKEHHENQVTWAQYGKAYLLTHMPTGKSETDINEMFPADPVAAGTEPAYITTADLKNNLTDAGADIGRAYCTLNFIETNEARAGSTEDVEAMMRGVIAIINNYAIDELGSTQWEQMDRRMAIRIKVRIETYFNETEGYVFRKKDNLNSVIPQYTDLSKEEIATLDDKNIPTFPTSIGLPVGAAQLLFNSTKRSYYYQTDEQTMLQLGLDSKTNVNNIMFPAELTYFGNSSIRVSNDQHSETSDYPTTAATWNNEEAGSPWQTGNWTTGPVTSTTNSVAMKDNINYGTALLKTTVSYGTNTSLVDNKKAKFYPDEDPVTITIGETSKPFELTGILIGNQSKDVNWQYIPPTTSTADAVIYDNDIPVKVIPATGNSDPVYTLVFDNYTTATTQSTVKVALELKNVSGKDFYGKDNLIRNGGTFYLVAELDPTATGLTAVTWPTNYALPPYNPSDGKTFETTRVFMQDYVTEANFVFSADALKHAYVTIPDLRSSQMSLGLSVDLSWSKGLVFNNIPLGNK